MADLAELRNGLLLCLAALFPESSRDVNPEHAALPRARLASDEIVLSLAKSDRLRLLDPVKADQVAARDMTCLTE